MVQRSSRTFAGARVLPIVAFGWAALLSFAHAGITDCPAADSDAGLNATDYKVSVTDTANPTVGYISERNVAFQDPETSGSAVSSGTIAVDIYCAKVEGAGCDGQAVSINTGITAGMYNYSYCLGCAGEVVPIISGLGAYNESHHSTCTTCYCNATGQPFRPGIGESFGLWNSTGNCTLDPITGSGQCNCSQLDGTPIVPLGPYRSYGNCSACNCSGNGSAYTPPISWNVSGPENNYYPTMSNGADPLCYLSNCSCDAFGNITNPRPVTYNVTMANSSLFYTTISVLDGQYCYLDNCSCDAFGNSTGLYTTTFNVTMVNKSSYYRTISVLDGQYCYLDNCSCDAFGNSTGAYTTTYNVTKANKSLFYTTISVLDGQYCYMDNCSCDAFGNSTGAYTTTFNVTKVNSSLFFKTISVLDGQYCYLDNCSCDAFGNSTGAYTTTYNVSMANSATHYPTITTTNQYCNLANCSCDVNGTATGNYITTHDTVTGPTANTYYATWNGSETTCNSTTCVCNSDGSLNTTNSYSACTSCGCQSCSNNATCTCDSLGNSTTTASTLWGSEGASTAEAVCGCGCQSVVQDCGCGCEQCSTNATCQCDEYGNSTTLPNTNTDGSLDTCGCQCIAWEHNCGCGCSSCDSAATCSCDQYGNSSTSPNAASDDALATCGCQCDPWEHNCGCGCSSCDTAATCSCDQYGNSTTQLYINGSAVALSSADSALATCGCQCDAWEHNCGCGCSNCDSAATCSCDEYGNSSTSPNALSDDSLATCGCQCDPWEHNCGCGCSSCQSEAVCTCDGGGNSSTFLFTNGSQSPLTSADSALATCGCQCDTWVHECGCDCLSCLSNSTCSCSDNGTVQTAPDLAVGYCGCNCIPHICECSCARDSCDCQCDKTCGCNCTRNECGYDTPDGKNYTPTGGDGPGGTCGVTANCYTATADSTHPGFFDGGMFTAYTGTITAHLLKYESGARSILSSSFLSNFAVTASSAVASFSTLAVTAAATFDNTFALYFSAVSQIYTTNETAAFTSIPNYFTVFQQDTTSSGLSSTVYQVSAGQADLGNYTLKFYGSDNQQITNVSELDGFNVSIFLVTGPNGDSSSVANYPSSYSLVAAEDLVVNDLGNGFEAVDDVVALNADPSSPTIDFSLSVMGHVGYYFQVVAVVERVSGTTTVILGTFRIDPSLLTVAFGPGYTMTFGSNLAPAIVRVDGAQSNSTNEDGLPPLLLQLEDDTGTLMSKSMCTNCAQVRLLQCADASGSMSYPTCASSAQAYCAGTDGTKCTNYTQFLDTLSGTTTASVINGTAEFTDVQLAYVLGAGYKLQFTLNPGSPGLTTASSVSSPHSNGEIQVPDDSYSTGGVNNTFFVRPYALEVAQNPGGDGVDIDSDNVPDGVGIGIPFRVQPAVVVKGNGYYFDKNWNRHGFTPITAIIASGACGGSCATNHLVLSGAITGVSTHGKSFAASDGTSAAINYISGNASTTEAVDVNYETYLAKMGQLWRDLQVDTINSYTGEEDVQIEFRCGPNNINVTDTIWYTAITSAKFDAMAAPDPPVNLRVANYNNLGFRIEFDPSPVLRTKPLSGFIVEVDECVTETNYSCRSLTNPFYSSAYNFPTILGSDFTRGGGFVEEVLVLYDNVSIGDPVGLNLTFEPGRSLLEGDSLIMRMGAPNVLFANVTSSCALAGSDASMFTFAVDATTSQLTLTVASGSSLVAENPVSLLIPSSCNVIMPGGLASEARYGGNTTYPLQSVFVAAVVGNANSTRFDNCKQGNSTTCVASATYVLPTIQDASSMDLSWSGSLQSGATGAACLAAVRGQDSNVSGTGTFPSNRFCSLDTPNSNDPDSLDTFSTGNGGDNGVPIGSNPGRAGSGGSVTTGTLFPDTDDACRDGTASKNPCTLSIGQDWKLGVNLSYFAHDTTANALGSVKVQFTRSRALAMGDEIKIPLTGIDYTQPDPVFPCATFSEGTWVASNTTTVSKNTSIVEQCTCVNQTNLTASNGSNIVTYPNCTCINVTVNNTDDYLQCQLLATSGYLDFSQVVSWGASINVASSVLTLTVGENVLPLTVTSMTISGFTASQKSTVAILPDEALAEVVRGSHMSVVVKSGAIRSTYTSGTTGDPVASYAQGIAGNPPTAPGVMTFVAGKVYNFRVYAYNGRFKSTSAETLVQNRAITPPAAPAYFTEQGQRAVGARYYFSNMAANQISNNAGTKSTTTVAATASTATRVGIFFTPAFDVRAGQSITFKLPGFTGPDYLVMGMGTSIPIWANKYTVTGNSSSCACSSVGTISTPSRTYTTTRSASGSGSCDAPSTNGTNSTNSSDTPSCACGGCACSLGGIVTTPSTIYNVSGNCSGCGCAATGTPIFPATTYNASGNCSSCACDSFGSSSFDSADNYVPDWTSGCDNCTCGGVGNATCPGGADSACTCSFSSCDCGCIPNYCNCTCPTFLECSCACPVKETFECGCYQNDTHPVITQAIWSGFTQSIVIVVDEGTFLPRDVAVEMWIPNDAGIKFPASGVSPLGPDGLEGGEGWVNAYKLNWASAFPSAAQPREGFLVQMTTDMFWRTDVQSVLYPDNLDRGVVRTQPLTHLTADMTATDTIISVAQEYTFLRGEYLTIESEYLYVKNIINTTKLEVKRGQFGTTAAIHLIVTGTASSGACSCSSSSAAVGGGTCVCTQVQVAYIGATDPSVSTNGIDTYTGANGGTGCVIGGTATVGCNPLAFNFLSQTVGTRTFQSGVIEGKVTPQVRYATACGGTFTSCTTNCLCTQTTAFTGYEFGNNGMLPKGNNVTIASIGDPFVFPLDYKTTLALAVDELTDSLSLAVADATGLSGKYIRVEDEIMFVEKITRGVLRVDTYQSFGGTGCSCSIAGVVSGGSSCSCIGTNGANCTQAGVLSATGGGGGLGFLAQFNISTTDGSFQSIDVSSPGYDFTSTPTIFISSGGVGCSGVNLRALLSSNVVKVTRGALGTTRAAHAVGTELSAVLWPSQTRATSPGLQYYFRIAAFNAAGLSPFLYHQLKLLDVFPRTLPAAGNVPMEVILTGGGVTAGNYTLYIGYLNAAGSVDLGRTKKCNSLVVQDPLGTRMSCQSPSWVGARHSLILHFQSGSQERIAVGNNWIKFEAPTVTLVQPAQVDAGLPVNITITGRNFGKNSSTVTGKLQGATPLTCTPLTVVSDLKAICTLIPAIDTVLSGDVILTVGNAWSGGGQSTKANANTKIKEKPAPVIVESSLPVTIDTIPAGSPERVTFVDTFATDISGALGVSKTRINVTDIRTGSVIITFVILPDPNSVAAASPAALAVNLAQQAADPASPLRQGTLTSTISVTIPPGTAALAASETAAATTTTTATDVPLWESSCVPKSYTAFDMEICYDCCTYVCEIGAQIPQVGGQNVLPGYRAQTCQGLCLVHCGYSRPITFGV